MSRKLSLCILVVVLVSGGLLAGCVAPAATPAGTPTPPTPFQPGATPFALTEAQLLSLALPGTGPGRDLVINNCLDCHGVSYIVLLGQYFDAADWQAHRVQHMQGMTPWLSKADGDLLWGYLSANIGPGHPVPNLPLTMADILDFSLY